MLIDSSTPAIKDDDSRKVLVDNNSLRIKDVDSRLLQRKWKPAGLIPIVQAASDKDPPIPPRPPKMKYTELPIYNTPHHDYKEYLEDKFRCPQRCDKLIHKKILPHVKSCREYFRQNAKDFCDEFKSMKNDAMASIYNQTGQFKCYMRHPDNMQKRLAVVTVGGMMGFCYAAKRGVPSRIFFTSLGLLGTGALCFPKETDFYFREVSFTVATIFLSAFAFFCEGKLSLRQRTPCESDVLPAPPARLKNKCPEWPFDKEFTKKPADWSITRKW